MADVCPEAERATHLPMGGEPNARSVFTVAQVSEYVRTDSPPVRRQLEWMPQQRHPKGFLEGPVPRLPIPCAWWYNSAILVSRRGCVQKTDWRRPLFVQGLPQTLLACLGW